jgi:hypothetical protein
MCWYGFGCHNKFDPLHDRRFKHPASIADEAAWLAECATEEARLRAIYEAEERLHPLPEGWLKVEHRPSGLDCYAHQQTGAVSWTRPYAVLAREPPTPSRAEEASVVESIATHEIPLFPFAMILQLSELVSRTEMNRQYTPRSVSPTTEHSRL